MTKTAFITGATSGFGQAAARRFARAGWRVVATGRRADRLQALADEFGDERARGGFRHPRRRGDAGGARRACRRRSATSTCWSTTPASRRARRPRSAPASTTGSTMIDTNITALVTLTRALLPKLIERRGAIINISSTAANYPYAGGNVYGGSKAFVSQFSLGLRADLHGTGVRVTTLEPGMAETEFTLVRTHGDQAASDALYRRRAADDAPTTSPTRSSGSRRCRRTSTSTGWK